MVRMGGRLDAGDVHFAQFLNMREHLAKLALELCDLIIGQVEPRKLRDIADVELVTHGPRMRAQTNRRGKGKRGARVTTHQEDFRPEPAAPSDLPSRPASELARLSRKHRI